MLAVFLKSLGGQGGEEVYCSIIIYFFTERSRHRLQTSNSLKPMFWEKVVWCENRWAWIEIKVGINTKPETTEGFSWRDGAKPVLFPPAERLGEGAVRQQGRVLGWAGLPQRRHPDGSGPERRGQRGLVEMLPARPPGPGPRQPPPAPRRLPGSPAASFHPQRRRAASGPTKHLPGSLRPQTHRAVVYLREDGGVG